MRLSATLLQNFTDINHFDTTPQWMARKNEPNSFYFQLIDIEADGLRYMSGDPAISIRTIFPAVDPTSVWNKVANQADARDRSIWVVNLSALEIPFSGNVQFEVTENGVIRRFFILQGLAIENAMNAGGGC